MVSARLEILFGGLHKKDYSMLGSIWCLLFGEPPFRKTEVFVGSFVVPCLLVRAKDGIL